MHRKLSLAATLCTLALLGAAAATAADSRPLTTAEAYQSWTAWYRLDGSRPADPNGPRYRQLLDAADGADFFVQGLTDASPQVRELSKQALLQLPLDECVGFALSELRMHTRDKQVEQAITEVFPRTPLGQFIAQRAAREPGTDTDAAILRSAKDAWQIPFGGLVRLALREECSAREEAAEVFCGPAYDDLTARISELQSFLFCPNVNSADWPEVADALARAEALRSSRDAAQKLLAWLDQTATVPVVESTGATIETVRRSLREHAPKSEPAVREVAARTESSLPLHCVGVELEQSELSRPQNAEIGASLVRTGGRKYGVVAPEPLEIAIERLREPLPLLWTPAHVDMRQALPPGTYKLLLTFERLARPSLEIASLALRETSVAAVVFRVKAASDNAAATSNLLDARSTDGDPEWEILRVAVSGSGLPDEDLCAPSPYTLILRACGEYRTPTWVGVSAANIPEACIDAPLPEWVNFSMSTAR